MTTMALQIMTHEMLMTKKSQLFPKKMKGGFNCCNPKNDTVLANLISINKYCLPISVKSDDTCYGNKARCLNYIRAMKSLKNCKLDSTALPTNFHTAFIDAELIYNELSLPHLDSNGGKFNVDNPTVMRSILADFDDRSIQLPGLFVYLNLFTRFHNLIFDELKKGKSSLSNQALSFEARKITTALYQKIFIDVLISVLRE